METKTEFVLKEKKIVDFYNQHPSINCEKANLLLVDFLETMFNHITDDLGTNVNSQLLSFMNENKTQLNELQQQVSSYREEVSKTHQEATSEVFTQLSSWKTKYMDDVKQLIENNQLSSNEKIGTFLDKNNMQLLDKTALLLNDAIPKNHNVLHQQIVYSLKEFNRQITEDTSKILTSSNNQNSMEQYIQVFENKYTTMLQSIQQPLFSVLS